MRLICFVLAATLVISSLARAGAEPPTTLDEYLTRLSSEADGKARRALFYELLQGLEERRISVTSANDATRLTTVLASLMEHDTESVTRWLAAEFLASHPHPAAREALLRVASTPGRENALARMNALRGLVSLHDVRALPLLAAENPLQAGLIAELGSPAGVAVLEEAVADSTRREHDKVAAARALQELQRFLESKIVNSNDLDDRQLGLLKRNGFVLIPGEKNEMFELYDEAYPFVTSDVVFHTFMILMRAAFSEMESLVLAPRVGELSRRLVFACLDQASGLNDPRLAAAARWNAAFFAVPAALIGTVDPDSLDLPANLKNEVRDELDKIRTHSGVGRSALFDRDEDFTKYLPRGRHASIPQLQGYFQGMLYLGRMMFQLQSNDETLRAILIAAAMEEEPELRSEWARIDSLTGEWFGERDDLALPDYEDAARHVTGSASPKNLVELAADDVARAALVAELRKRPKPRINTLGMESSESRRNASGLRIFGQRYSRPSEVLQQRLEGGHWPLSGLSVAAELLDSRSAGEILRDSGLADTTEIHIVPARAADRFASLMDGYLESARSLFQLEAGAPEFMRKPAWEEKQINAALGGWAEVQHATALYTKDANHYLGMSGMLDRFHGYVEPVPQFYSSLDTLLARVVGQLDEVGLWDRIAEDKKKTLAGLEPPVTAGDGKSGSRADYMARLRRDEANIRLERGDLEEFSSILRHLGSLATRELHGEPQTIDDGFFLKGLHRRLMRLSFQRSGTNVAQTSMAVITDVASEYSTGECFEVGVARPWIIYAGVPDDGRTFICKGAVYSYTEFTQPIQDRLDDTRWREMSRYVDEAEHLPWIATRPDLGFVRTLSRSEVEELRSITTDSGANEWGGSEPWRPSRHRQTAGFWVGAQVAPEDVDLLLDLAQQDALDLGVRGFVLEQMGDMGSDKRVLAAFDGQVQKVANGGNLANMDMCRIYYSIRGLGNCGRGALPVLDQVESVVARMDERMRPVFDTPLRKARASIAEYPKGRSRTP